MIFLHKDRRYQTDQWYRRFEHQLRAKRLSYKKIDLLRRDFRNLKVKEGDALIGRFGHAASDLNKIKPIYHDLALHFKDRIFPSQKTYKIYDNKWKQLALLFAGNYSTPKAAWVSTSEEVEKVIAEQGLGFPIVAKKNWGAGSTNVRLAHAIEDVYLPGIIQEFCPGNDRDLRLTVIGQRVMGFYRLNFPNDFRASGSGKLIYPDNLPQECVELVYRISKEHSFESMAYDLVKDEMGRWVVLEMSYAYVDQCVRDCPFFIDGETSERVKKIGVYPQDFILDDFLQKHPLVESLSQNSKQFGNRFSHWWHRQTRGKIQLEQNEQNRIICRITPKKGKMTTSEEKII